MSKHGFDDASAGHRQQRSGRAMRVVGWLSVVMCTVLVAGTLTAYAGYRNLAGNIGLWDVSGQLGDRPEDVSEAKNILLIGSDTRSVEGTSEYGSGISGARSDTVILLHLPPDRDEALLVSFPRDSWVDIPSCTLPNGTKSEPQTSRLNSAFSIGGPGCTWKTIETLTDIHIDHFIMVNFAGFKNVVNALGGIEVCLPFPVSDEDSGLDLPAGPQVVRGEQALAFVRVRHIGNGSDLQRIKRQQEFLAGMVKQATDMGLLLNPGKLYNFLDAATKSLTTDKSFGLSGLQKLALSSKNISPSDVNFVTVPVVGRADGATVAWQQPQASQLFQAIRMDSKLPKKSPDQQKKSGKKKPKIPPEQVRVQVLNGTTIPGLAGETADQLRAAGFTVTKVGNASEQTHTQTLIRHPAQQAAAARTLLAGMPSLPPQSMEVGQGPAGTVALILGEDAAEGPVITDPSDATKGPVPEGVDKINGASQPCKTGPQQG